MGRLPDRFVVRAIGVVATLGGLLGSAVWFADLSERVNGDSLRYGLWHNPYIQFPIFSYAFVEPSCWLLFGCSIIELVGGVALMIPVRFGRILVAWQARVAIVINAVTVLGIIWMLVFMMPKLAHRFEGTPMALMLRLVVLAVDAVLLVALTGRRVDSGLTDTRAQGGFPVLPVAEGRHAVTR